MTLYIAAYDTESATCLEACRKIVAVHRRYEMPATFFVTGQVLEANPDAYRELLNDELFEISSHGYAHKMVRSNPLCGPAAPMEEIKQEITLGKQWVERVFERPCKGFRTPVGHSDGLKGAPEIVRLVSEAGFDYVSSMLWGPDCSLPAHLVPPFRYEQEGMAPLWEMPAHGWHENLLKGNNGWGAKRVCLFPPYMPETIPLGFVKSAEEEFKYNNKPFIDRAIADKSPYVTLIWHPWSLLRFDPEMRMLEITFQYVRERGLGVGRFADAWAAVNKSN